MRLPGAADGVFEADGNIGHLPPIDMLAVEPDIFLAGAQGMVNVVFQEAPPFLIVLDVKADVSRRVQEVEGRTRNLFFFSQSGF